MSSREYKVNHKKAWCYFIALGLLPVDARKHEWCLHHKDPTLKYKDPRRYNEWRTEDLVPMKISDHVRLHQKGKKREPVSDETRKKISEAVKAAMTPEVRQKISEAGKGRPCSEETRMKRSAAMKGHAVSEDTRRKISAAQKGKKRGPQPEETRIKRAETLRKTLSDPEKRKALSKRTANLVWITNGTSCTRIPKGEALPEGWRQGRTLSDQAKKAIGRPGIARGPMDNTTKKKISNARKGMKFSDEHRRHLSEAHKKTSL